MGLAACPAMNRFEVLPAIINEARLIVHQFLEPRAYDSSKRAAAELIKCLGAI
jgi:hypothetical protein